jgi:hypothetical protein
MNSPKNLTRKDVFIVRTVYAVLAVWTVGWLLLAGYIFIYLGKKLLGI